MNKKKKGLSKGLKIGLGCCGGSVVLLVVLVVIALKGVQTALKPTPTPSTTQNTTITPTTTPAPKYIYDIPALIGKNIDEIRAILGEPVDKELTEPTQEQISLGAKEWDNTFKKDDFDLLVTFNISSRKIVDFFVDTSSKYPDKNKLMEVTNTKENANNYTIESVKELKNSSNITGIKIIPK
ncbi:MAG: hypothetical protein AAB785_02455 [Patescibacteria group bacterium]